MRGVGYHKYAQPQLDGLTQSRKIPIYSSERRPRNENYTASPEKYYSTENRKMCARRTLTNMKS
jgi:hypothetical protein